MITGTGRLSLGLAVFSLAMMLGLSDARAQFAPSGGITIDASDNPFGGGKVILAPGQVVPSSPGGPVPQVPSGQKPSKDAGKKKDGAKKEGEKKDGEKKEGEKPKSDTTTRAKEPSEPADPKELEARPDDDGKVSFQFHGQTWPDVLDWLAEVSDVALDWQELPSDYLNLKTRRPYTLEETRDLINQRLLTRGYTILSQGEGITVVKIEKLNPAMVPRVTSKELADRMPHEFVKVSFDMDWLIATEVVPELATLKSPQGKLTPMPGANRIEAMDAVINLREISEAIELQKSPERRKQHVREFVLEFTRADDVATQLREFLGAPAATPTRSSSYGRSGGVSPQQLQQMQQVLIQQMQRNRSSNNSKSGPTITAKKIDLRVVANTRRNSIVVHASPDKMAIADEFISLVDVRNDAESSLDALTSRMQVFRLASLDPQELMETLTSLGGLEPRTKLSVDDDNNALIVYGSLADQVLIKSVIDRLDGSGRQSEVIQLRRLPADQVAGSIMFLMGGQEKKNDNRNSGWYDPWSSYSRSREKKQTDQFKVTANVEYNQLLVWANEIELKEVNNLLEKLGEVQTRDTGSRVRVISAGDPDQMRTFLKQLQQAWPGENELLLPAESDLPKPLPKTSPDASDKKADGDAEKDEKDTSTANAKDADGESPNGPKRGKKPSLIYRDSKATTTTATPIVREIPVAMLRRDEAPAPATGSQQPESKQPESQPTQPKVDDSGVPVEESPSAEEQAENELLRRRLEMLKRFRQQAIDQEEAAPEQPRKRPPIRVSVNAKGELVFSSDDTKALALIEELAEQLAPKQKVFEVFHLKHASAFWVRFNLEDFFEEEEDDDNGWMAMLWGFPPQGKEKAPVQLGAKKKPPRFIDDLDTNTILVQNADPQQLETIAELIKLYDVEEPVTSDNMRFTQVFYIKYSKPTLIESTIKEALKDLLSSNDKALQQNRQQGGNNGRNNQQPPPQSSGPSIKGKLSIGSDDVSRVMIVSCEGEQLMEIVTKMIETLDRAAKPAAAVDMVKVNGGINMQKIQAALNSFTPAKAKANAPRNQQQPQQPQPQPQPPQNNQGNVIEFGGFGPAIATPF